MNSKRLVLTFFTLIALATTSSFVAAERGGDRDGDKHEGRDGDRHDGDRDGDHRDGDHDGDRDKDDGTFINDIRSIRGLEISPVPIDLRGKRGLVGLGSYLVNAAGVCAECHTCPTWAPGHDPFTGGDGQINATNFMAGGVHFGPFVSANITPDAKGLPAGMTEAEFVATLRTGREHGTGPILQVMPWAIYRNLTDRDLRAIYAYLSAIPHAEPGACGGPGE